MRWFVSLRQSLWSRIAALRCWLAGRLQAEEPRFRYERVEEFPDSLKPFTIYVAGEEPHLWAAAMLCPCGCGDVIELNLLKDASPCWSVRLHADGSVSLVPSVWRRRGCRSHFFVRYSRIEWYRARADLSSE